MNPMPFTACQNSILVETYETLKFTILGFLPSEAVATMWSCGDHFNMKRSRRHESYAVNGVSKFIFSRNLWNFEIYYFGVLTIWSCGHHVKLLSGKNITDRLSLGVMGPNWDPLWNPPYITEVTYWGGPRRCPELGPIYASLLDSQHKFLQSCRYLRWSPFCPRLRHKQKIVDRTNNSTKSANYSHLKQKSSHINRRFRSTTVCSQITVISFLCSKSETRVCSWKNNENYDNLTWNF